MCAAKAFTLCFTEQSVTMKNVRPAGTFVKAMSDREIFKWTSYDLLTTSRVSIMMLPTESAFCLFLIEG